MTEGHGPGNKSSSGVNYDEADRNQHDDWFLHSKSGAPLRFDDYSFLWAANVGNVGYVSRWTDNVLADVTRNGWDGVFLDDANSTIKYHHPASDVREYASDAAYRAATAQMLQTVGARLRAAGTIVVANVCCNRESPGVFSQFVSPLSGGGDEQFGKWGAAAGQGYVTGADLATQFEEVRWSAANGKAFLAITQGAATDRAAARWGLANLLLVASSGTEHFYYNSDYEQQPWFPEMDLVASLGAPKGAFSTTPEGGLRRVFERGVVVVNHTGGSVRLALPAGTWSGSDYSRVTSVTLGATSAAILRAD